VVPEVRAHRDLGRSTVAPRRMKSYECTQRATIDEKIIAYLIRHCLLRFGRKNILLLVRMLVNKWKPRQNLGVDSRCFLCRAWLPIKGSLLEI